jgi:hypothetical protein
MSISDADYLLWLQGDAKRRALLVEAVAYDGVTAATQYLSNHAFVSGPADTPPDRSYEDIIADVPSYSARLSEAFTGFSQTGWGDIVVVNESGVRDSWLAWAWDGRAVAIYYGDPAWSRGDFRSIFTGVGADVVALDRNRLSLRIRDKSWAVDVNIQTSLVGGSTANANKPKPLCFGQCFNVEPVLTVAATHEYQVHDGQIEDVTDVRDNGVSVGYAKDLANGKFTLTAAPTNGGRITADVKGAKPAGSYKVTCADIVEHIITTRTSLTTSDRDATSFSDMNTTCPQTLGTYIRDFTTVAAVVDELVAAVGGFWCFDRDGKMMLGRFDAPSGVAALELVADDVVLNGIRVARRFIPVQTYKLGYKRNFTPQADGLAGAVSEAARAAYAAEFLTKTATNAGITTAHLLARNADEAGTVLVDATEAQTECTRRATLWNTLRYVYEVQCFVAPFKVRLGQVIQLTHSRFGFGSGELCTIVGFREMPTRGRIALELFR